MANRRPNGRNPRRAKAVSRPNPPKRLKPCGQLFAIKGCHPHDFKKKWQVVLKDYGFTMDQGMPADLADDLASIIDLALGKVQDYLNTNHPRHADLKDQDAYALFFPLISEAVMSAGCSGYLKKTDETKELEAELAMAEYKARNID